MRQHLFAVSALTLLLAACGGMQGGGHSSQRDLPKRERLPDGQRVVFRAHGSGSVTYECDVKEDALRTATWVQSGSATLSGGTFGSNTMRLTMGPGPGMVFDSSDGSSAAGSPASTQPSPRPALDMPYQLVKITGTRGRGILKEVTYVERVDTQGGAQPNRACTSSGSSSRETIRFEADYIFYGER